MLVGVVFNIRIDDLERTNLLIALGVFSLFSFGVVAVLCLATMRTRNWQVIPLLYGLCAESVAKPPVAQISSQVVYN